MSTAESPAPSRWMVHVWLAEWRTIAQAEALAAERRAWQPDRLRQMVSTSELARLLGCTMGHASDLRSGRREVTPEQVPIIAAHVAAKISHQ